MQIERKYARRLRWDARNEDYLLQPKRTVRQYRSWQCQHVCDQRATPQCVGYTWHHLLACAPNAWNVSAGGIYYLAQRCDEWAGEKYEGTSNLGAAQAMKAAGVIDGYYWIQSADLLANALLTRGPVALGMRWRAHMARPDSAGYIVPAGEELGGHAMLVVGYDARGQRPYFTLLNSWGTDWGDNGRCRVWVEHMSAILADDGDAVYASRPMTYGAFD